MLDSGISCHMSGELEFFNDVRNVMLVNVALPNGKEMIVSKKVMSILSDNIKHNNALYAPDLCCNLISVGQVSGDFNCFIIFYDDICILQDCTPRSLIRASELI